MQEERDGLKGSWEIASLSHLIHEERDVNFMQGDFDIEIRERNGWDCSTLDNCS